MFIIREFSRPRSKKQKGIYDGAKTLRAVRQFGIIHSFIYSFILRLTMNE